MGKVRSKAPPGTYRPLPTGTHGLDPALVKLDQSERLQSALIELIELKGYQAVRIADLTKLARVSQPTFYCLFRDKEELFAATYDSVAARAARAILETYDRGRSRSERLSVALHTFARLAGAEPQAISLLVLGAFGAGPSLLERRRQVLEELETRIRSSRDPGAQRDAADLTVKFIIGGIREVTAARLREGRASELGALADQLTAWAVSYPTQLEDGVTGLPHAPPSDPSGFAASLDSDRARRAQGRLPSGRNGIPRQFITKSQRERIVDATAAIVAEKGLAKLTIPEIARRANVSLQTFYEIYASKHDAFLGAQKVGMHQALQISAEAYDAHGDSWPCAVAAGLRALIDYLSSEPAHAHLSVVDTFAASPEAIDIRDTALRAFATFLGPGCALAPELPPIASEAVVGGIWQILHHYIASNRLAELPDAACQLTYLALTPFLGPREAAAAALQQTSVAG
jgi:AcrR family transcriptional regulator